MEKSEFRQKNEKISTIDSRKMLISTEDRVKNANFNKKREFSQKIVENVEFCQRSRKKYEFGQSVAFKIRI